MKAWAHTCEMTSSYFSSAVNGTVVLDGGQAEPGDYWYDKLLASAENHVLPNPLSLERSYSRICNDMIFLLCLLLLRFSHLDNEVRRSRLL
jgi:hypothetical protein